MGYKKRKEQNIILIISIIFILFDFLFLCFIKIPIQSKQITYIVSLILRFSLKWFVLNHFHSNKIKNIFLAIPYIGLWYGIVLYFKNNTTKTL